MGSERYMNKKLIIIEMSDSWMFLNNNKNLWHELVEDWIYMWTLCCVITLPLYAVLKDTGLMYRTLFLILSVWMYTLIRRNIKYLSVFILLSLLNAAVVYFVGQSLFEKAVYVLIMIIMFGNSVKRRYSEVVNYYSINGFLFCEALLGVCYIIAFGFSLDIPAKFVTAGGIVIALSSVLYIHLTRTEKLMEWEEEFAQKFTGRLKKLKIAFSSIIVLVISCAIWFMWKIGAFELLDKLQSYINSLFGTKPINEKPLPIQPKQAPENEDNMMEALRNLGGESKSNIFIEIILRLIEMILVVVAVILLFYLLRGLFLKLKELYHQFYLRAPKNEKREFVFTAEDFTRTLTEKIEKGKREFNDLLDRSSRRRIRKIYYKIIEGYRRQGIIVNHSNTPEEIGESIRKKKNKDLDKAIELYEKARYSNHECSEKEVEEIKQYL
jgi:hypothetical protein